jgi:hypothetical protein
MGKAVVNFAGARIKAPSWAGVANVVGFWRAEEKSALAQEVMRERTFSREASSLVEC